MVQDIVTIFTTEDKNDIKEAIKKILIEQIRVDLMENRYAYIVRDDELADMVDELIRELKEEVKAEYKDILRKKFEIQLAGL